MALSGDGALRLLLPNRDASALGRKKGSRVVAHPPSLLVVYAKYGERSMTTHTQSVRMGAHTMRTTPVTLPREGVLKFFARRRFGRPRPARAILAANLPDNPVMRELFDSRVGG
jgi:hypothetical protein